MLPLEFAMTKQCIFGSSLASKDSGNELCSADYGFDWRWLEFHESEANGWTATGLWINTIGVGERGWVWIDDNDGLCSENDHGLTWIRPEGDTCKASCTPGTGLEGSEDQPYMGACNPYQGDTPCEECRRLICVQG